MVRISARAILGLVRESSILFIQVFLLSSSIKIIIQTYSGQHMSSLTWEGGGGHYFTDTALVIIIITSSIYLALPSQYRLNPVVEHVLPVRKVMVEKMYY